MTYSYEDSKGFIGAGPSIGGAAALLEALRPIPPANYPNIRELLSTGESDNPDAVAGEAKRLLTRIKDRDVRDTLQKLASAAARSQGVITITH